ncbi:putative phage tail protein [Paenibacillus alvei]|uniref:putative phage tail protein n=1 Tax=Paenibacillus alvei TaxID=44250 RepID=UPI002281ECBD|nr:putative phage tail protein [Paenibacillus alvei]MCY7484341.1 YmfQ family protein [Paenibacillus alvei]
MIPLKYRQALPPYWYEIDMVDRHFSVMEEEMDGREKTINDLGNQFMLQRATWALSVWEWIYFQAEQSGADDQRREAIRKKRLANKPFKLPVLRAIGEQHGKLIRVEEDFLAKEILFEFTAEKPVDLKRLYADFEYIRPVHVLGANTTIQTETETIVVSGQANYFTFDFPICGLEMPMG